MLHRHGSRGPGGDLHSPLSLISPLTLFLASELTPWADDHPIKAQWQEHERENLSSAGRLQVLSPFLPLFDASPV
jgi:hypothetical protein